MNWFTMALTATFCFAGMFLITKQLGLVGITTSTILFYIYGAGFLAFTFQMLNGKGSFAIGISTAVWLVAASLFSIFGNYLNFRALTIAPNPGYVVAISAMQGVLVTLGAIFFFGSDISTMKLVGIALSVAGTTLLALS